MKIDSDQFTVKAGGLAGFLAMVVIGWNFTGGPAGTVGEAPAPAATRSSRPRPSKPPGNRDVSAAKMALIRNAESTAERMRATINLANELPLSEFGKWLGDGWFDLRDGAELMLFSQIVRDRWWREDPEAFMLWNIARKNYWDNATLLEVWIKKDPQRVIDFFKRHPDNIAELDALADLAGTHPDLALQRLLEMNNAGLCDDIIFHGDTLIRKLVEKSPAAMESSLDSLKQPVRELAERFLVLEKFKVDYAGELRKLWARPDGFGVYFSIVSKLEGEPGRIVEDLASLPPAWRNSIALDAEAFIDEKSAEKWWNADLAGVGFSPSEVYDLRARALRELAAKNPETALRGMAVLMVDVDHEREWSSFVDRSNIIENALTAHPEKAAELTALLVTEKDREIARTVLGNMPEENDRKAAAKIETPELWLEKTAVISPAMNSTYGAILQKWDSVKLSALGEQFRSLPDEQKQHAATVIASGVSSDDHNPALYGEAIRYLLIHPAGAPLVDPDALPDSEVFWLRESSIYAGNLAVTEPETARDWVQSLPEGEPKLWAQVNLRSIWSQYDPKAADQWFRTLPATVQAEVLKNTKKKD
jgi:hypothetical protein